MKGLRFVDLFAGLGGFHLALRGLGHECVFASEADPELRELYLKNFVEAHGLGGPLTREARRPGAEPLVFDDA